MMFRTTIAAIAIAVAIPAAPAMAQETDHASIAEQQAAMKKLSWMFGAWRGPGSGVTRAGPYQVVQTERIGPMLDGTLVVIEGKGYRPDGSIGFNAFAVISYDPQTKRYMMRSYALGHYSDFELTLTDKGYNWEIPAGPGAVIRYTMTLKDGTWNEVGDYVASGQPPRRIFEMNLQRVGDTGWPLAGSIPLK
jgi:hypothetical protein